jgi:hypothetical protein
VKSSFLSENVVRNKAKRSEKKAKISRGNLIENQKALEKITQTQKLEQM